MHGEVNNKETDDLLRIVSIKLHAEPELAIGVRREAKFMKHIEKWIILIWDHFECQRMTVNEMINGSGYTRELM